MGAQLLGHCGLAGAWSGRRIAGAQQACGGWVSEGNISSPDSPTEYVRMRSETCQLSFCDEVESSSRTPVLSPQSTPARTQGPVRQVPSSQLSDHCAGGRALPAAATAGKRVAEGLVQALSELYFGECTSMLRAALLWACLGQSWPA